MYASTSHDRPVSGSLLDNDPMLYELSMARNSAIWPLTNFPSRRPRAYSSRVTKPGSAGSSPTRIQRRRTSASHRLAKYRSELYPYQPPSNHLQQDIRLGLASGSMPARPFSWHPSTMITNAIPFPDFASPSQPYPLEYQTVDVNGMPTPLTQADLRTDMPVDWAFSLDEHTVQHDPHTYCTPSYPINSNTNPYASFYQCFQPSTTNTFSPTAGSLQGCSQAMAFTAPPTPDVLPIQHPTDPLTHSDEPETQEDDGAQLVGMGLYDAPTAPSFLFDHGAAPGSAASSPTGKGLKLEETWEPPSEDDADADADDEEDAEGEDDDEEKASESNSAKVLPTEQTSDSASLNIPIERPASESSPTTTLGMPIESTDQIVSPHSVEMPIEQPGSAKFSIPIQLMDTGTVNMPIEHTDSLSPQHPALHGRTFYLENDIPAAIEEHQMWTKPMLMYGLESIGSR